MNYDYHLIVLGAGSGGLVVASGCAALGARVALIEEDKMGGDCLNTGCVPSKAFLKCAHLAHDITHAPLFGLEGTLGPVDLGNVMDRVQSIIRAVAPKDSQERYEGLGVKVFREKGVLLDTHRVQVGETTLTGRHIVIATGSGPAVPPIPGLREATYQTNETIFNLRTLPKHLVILGAGPIGLELGQGFRHLGSEVSMVDMLPSIFNKDDPEVGPVMEKKFSEDGIRFYLSSKIVGVEQAGDTVSVKIEKDGEEKTLSGDCLLVALGRVPKSRGFGLEDVGVETDKRGYIVTSPTLQTSVKNIYACGDVTGPYQFTHMADYQAGIAIRNAIFKMGRKVDYSGVAWTTYTRPEVAHVGYTEPWARSLGLFGDILKVDLNEIDRAKAENDEAGFLKLILNKKNRIIGVTLVGEKAGEMIPVATLAIKKKLKANAFMSLIFSYPTEAEVFRAASLAFTKNTFKGWKVAAVKRLFLR